MKRQFTSNRVLNTDKCRLEFDEEDLVPSIRRRLSEGIISVWDLEYTSFKLNLRREFMFWLESRGFHVIMHYQGKEHLIVFNKYYRNGQ